MQRADNDWKDKKNPLHKDIEFMASFYQTVVCKSGSE